MALWAGERTWKVLGHVTSPGPRLSQYKVGGPTVRLHAESPHLCHSHGEIFATRLSQLTKAVDTQQTAAPSRPPVHSPCRGDSLLAFRCQGCSAVVDQC